jgi:regulatory protein
MRNSRPNAKLAALRLLAQRRLTEAALYRRLVALGYTGKEAREAMTACTDEGYLDDALYARLFVEGRAKLIGDARMVAELVRRGVDREMAIVSVAEAEHGEEERLDAALGKLFRMRPTISYPSAARALERLGFSTAAIYRTLRAHAQLEHLSGSQERSSVAPHVPVVHFGAPLERS